MEQPVEVEQGLGSTKAVDPTEEDDVQVAKGMLFVCLVLLFFSSVFDIADKCFFYRSSTVLC